MTKSIQSRARDAFALVLLVPLVLGGLGIWTARRYRENIELVSHTQTVLSAIDQVRLSTRAAESGQRGFLLTGENDYLKAYQAAAAEAPRDIQDLRMQTRDNPVQQRNVSRLAVLVNTRLNKLKELVALWTPRQRGQNESELVLSSGRELMQQIQDLCTVMEKEENRLLANRLEAQRRTEREVALCFVLGLLANFVLLYWAYRLIEQYGLARDVAEAEIRELNNELENRVHERTSELEQANSNLRRSN